jgi:hypothetical protein
VVLEDDEADTPEPAPEAAAVSVSVDAGADPTSELSKGPWWDVEDECYVEQEGLASTPALAQPYSHHDPPWSSQDQFSKHNDDGMGGAPDNGEILLSIYLIAVLYMTRLILYSLINKVNLFRSLP